MKDLLMCNRWLRYRSCCRTVELGKWKGMPAYPGRVLWIGSDQQLKGIPYCPGTDPLSRMAGVDIFPDLLKVYSALGRSYCRCTSLLMLPLLLLLLIYYQSPPCPARRTYPQSCRY